MRSTLYTITTNIIKLSLPLLSVLTILLFLPITADFFTPHKQLTLVITSLLVLLSWAIYTVINQEIRLTNSPSLVAFTLFTLLYLLSGRLQGSNFIETLRGPLSIILSLYFIYLATTSLLKDKNTSRSTHLTIGISLAVANLIAILCYLGLFSTLGNYLSNKAFNTLGGPLPLLLANIIFIPGFFIHALKSKDSFLKITSIVYLISAIAGSIVTVLLLRPSGLTPIILLPLNAGWNIAVDILKNPRTALLGFGPSSFSSAYNLFKPISINSTNLWSVRFGSSSNEVLNLLTTIGVPGLLFYLTTFLKTGLSMQNSKELSGNHLALANKISLFIAIGLQFFFPANITLLILSVILLILCTIDLKSADDSQDIVISIFAAKVVKTPQVELPEPKAQKRTEILPWVFLVTSILVIAYFGLLHAPAYASKIVFYQSLLAASKNNGTESYNLQIKAINYNRYDPAFRLTYSQTNLALANAIASKSDVTEQDRNNIATLIQQSIREAKAGVTLDPSNSLYWQNLANIYRQLINLAEESDKWAIASYNRAIELDPLNPQLRLDLGGVYYALGNYDQAINTFSQAVAAKPDWANAHYNLAASYKQKKDYQNALSSLNNVLRLLNNESADTQKVQDEIKELEKLLKDQKPTTPSTNQTGTETGSLTTPTPIPSPSITPITLPDIGSGLNLDTTTPPVATPTPTQSN